MSRRNTPDVKAQRRHDRTKRKQEFRLEYAIVTTALRVVQTLRWAHFGVTFPVRPARNLRRGRPHPDPSQRFAGGGAR